MTSIALFGLGEVGRVLAEAALARADQLAGAGPIRVWDTAFDRPDSRATGNATALGLDPAGTAEAAVAGASVVFSAVTAANTLTAAESAAPALTAGTWFVDLNSASPGQKQAAAEVVEAAGGRYVEAAVMSPIHPRRLGAPVLLGGPHAAEFAPLGRHLGWSGLTVYSDQVGPAAATKLARSIVVKGLEALVTESMLTARAWGVEGDVLDSLADIIPVPDWPAFAQYLISRSVEHGTRRGEEMREAAATVAAAGVTPSMSTATAERQEWAGGLAIADPPDDLTQLVDRIRAAS